MQHNISPESFLKAISSSILWKGLDRVAGFIKHIIIAATLGLGAQLDVFYMAVAFLGVFVFSWAKLLDVIAVPDMVKAWKEDRKEEFRQIASGLFSFSLIISLLLAIILYFARAGIAEIAIGFEQNRKHLLAEAIPWLLAVIVLYIPMRSMGAVLRALRNFSKLYQSEFLISLSILICVLGFRENEHVLLWSYSVGIIVAFLFYLNIARQYIFPFSNPFSFVVRRTLRLAPGLLVLQGISYVFILTNRIFVSHLPEGEVSALAYGMMLPALLPGLLALGNSFITIIAEQNDRSQRAERLNDLISMAIYIGLGGTAFILMAGQSVIQSVFERGAFTVDNTGSVTRALSAYAWSILPMILTNTLDRVFQVERKIGLIVRRSLLGVLANIFLTAWFLFGLQWGVYGVALATSISYWVMLLAGLSGLEYIGYNIERRRHLRWACCNVFALAFASAGFVILMSFFGSGVFALFIGTLMFGGSMLLMGLFYRGREQDLIKSIIRRCLSRRGFS